MELVGWLVGRSVGRSVGWLVGWLVDRSVGWLLVTLATPYVQEREEYNQKAI